MTQPGLAVRAALGLARKTPLGRGKARRHVLRFIEANTKEPFTSQVMGCPFVIHFDNETERKMLFNNYNRPELNFLTDACNKPDGVFIDIGANCGYFTQILASTLPAGATIIAIEPNQIMCARAEKNFEMLRAAGMANGVTINLEQCAVGEASQVSQLHIPEGPNGFGGASIATDGEGIDIQMCCLEEILERNNVSKVDALKIDIEGYEERALVPFFKKAPRSLFPKAIVIEHTSNGLWQTDLLPFLADKGYVEETRTRSNAMLKLKS